MTLRPRGGRGTLWVETSTSLLSTQEPAAENSAQTGACLSAVRKQTKQMQRTQESRARADHSGFSTSTPSPGPAMLSGRLTAPCHSFRSLSSLCFPSLSTATDSKEQFERSIWMKWLDYNRETIGGIKSMIFPATGAHDEVWVPAGIITEAGISRSLLQREQ